METQFKLNLPPKMRECFGYHVKGISDREHRELMPTEVYDIFLRDFVNIKSPLDVKKTAFTENSDGSIEGAITVAYREDVKTINAKGNGGLNCTSTAIKAVTGLDYSLESYTQHAIEERSTSSAASYVSLKLGGKVYWGAGIDSDISISSIKALVSAVNKILVDNNG
jgi:2-isopropylmalate synthase